MDYSKLSKFFKNIFLFFQDELNVINKVINRMVTVLVILLHLLVKVISRGQFYKTVLTIIYDILNKTKVLVPVKFLQSSLMFRDWPRNLP